MASTGPTIDQTTILSLLSTVAILATAYFASQRLLPANTSTKLRIIFIWHAWDALIHTFLEGGYLYNSFFTYHTTSKLWAGINSISNSPYLAPHVHLFGDSSRVYGSKYGTNPLAALWREYAKADARWGESDLTIISLEMLTVLIGAPLAAYICYLMVQGPDRKKNWFWMLLLATGELYGGFMTFAPEWLSGNSNLDCSNWMYLWLYLTFFNALWVVIPFWILYEGYYALVDSPAAVGSNEKKRN